jgi:RNase P subunit RPR2
MRVDAAGQGEREAAAPDPESGPADAAPMANVYAWNRVRLNRAATCAGCAAALTRGSDGFVGLSDQPSDPRVWLCAACGEAL